MLRAHGVTDKGRVRATNEDYFVIDERLHLCVVADGMGGHNAGEVAARMAVDAIVEFVRASVQRSDAQPARSVDETWPFGLDPALSESGNLLRTAVHLANEPDRRQEWQGTEDLHEATINGRARHRHARERDHPRELQDSQRH